LLGAGVDSLSNDLPGWNNQFAELQYVRRQSQRYLIRLARDARSRRSDVSTAVGAAFSGESWFGGGDLSLAPGASFQPRNAYSLHAGRSFADGWVGTVSGYRRAYETATVSGTALIIERYFGDYRIAYKVGRSRLHGATGFSSHTLTGNWYYTEASNVGISLGGGDEAESIGDGRILVTAVRNVALTGRHRVNPRVSLHWWLGTHKQGDLYRRRYLGVAVSIGI
jgi:YaiO family outer membrane protein